MDESVKMAEGIFGRCQTCVKNLMKSICAFSCSNEGSDWMVLHELHNLTTNLPYVSAIDMFVSEEYLNDTFDSCIQVNYPSSGRLAMDLACGSYDARRCTPPHWFKFMGDADTNPLVPFTINYIVSEEPTRFKANVLPCDEAHPEAYACACVDCRESCPDSEAPHAEDPGFMVLGLNGYSFVVGTVMTLVGLILCAALLIFHEFIVIKELPRGLGGVDFINVYLTRFFRWWGTSE